LAASGGTGALTFHVSSGALPAGLNLDGSSGAITGTPTAAGTFPFTIAVTDTVSASAQQAYTIVVNPALTIATASLPSWTVKMPLYGLVNNLHEVLPDVVASGGTGALAFRVSSGTLPPGLSLNGNNGAISGTPTTAGTFPFTIAVTDAVGAGAQQAYTLTINPAIALGPVFPNGQPNQPYVALLQATGGTGPLSFLWFGLQLPTGLTLDPTTGILSGVPSTPGAFFFAVLVVDTVGSSMLIHETVTIGPPTSAVNPLPTISPPHFTVSWSGTATAGARIVFYDVYVSDNGGPFTVWQSQTTATSATFPGQDGHRYAFYSIATDSVGSQQPAPPIQASTTVLTPHPAGKVTVRRGPSSSRSATFFLTNAGPAVQGPVYLVLTRVGKNLTILNDTGVSTVVAPGSPFLQVADHLAVRGKVTVRVRFRGKGRAGPFQVEVFAGAGPL
jgi:hypothetical protein